VNESDCISGKLFRLTIEVGIKIQKAYVIIANPPIEGEGIKIIRQTTFSH
jgi:hypothetical protein